MAVSSGLGGFGGFLVCGYKVWRQVTWWVCHCGEGCLGCICAVDREILGNLTSYLSGLAAVL